MMDSVIAGLEHLLDVYGGLHAAAAATAIAEIKRLRAAGKELADSSLAHVNTQREMIEALEIEVAYLRAALVRIANVEERPAMIASQALGLVKADGEFCPHGIRNGPENCIACEDPTKLPEAQCDVAGGCPELRFMRVQRDAALRARDALHAALDRIRKIGPLGVDTYPECYRQMRAIAVEALNGEPS